MKAQKIYNITMALMDEMKDNGEVDIASTRDYLARTPGILSVLQNELQLELGINEYLDEIETMEDEVEIEDIICITVIPYGLASKLLMQEDTVLSNYFSSLYENHKQDYLNRYQKKSKQVKRPDVYNSTMRVGD